MNTQKTSDTQTDLSRVLAKIAEIVAKSADGDYIYRGEPECYEKVSSSLYREYPHREETQFDIVSAQETILAEAKAYIGKTDDIDETDNIGILTDLQHFGGKTNLIDFTEDYLIALFFACDGSHDKKGRVILLKRESDDYAIESPRRTISRVESQKSIFVVSPTGFVEPDHDLVVTIPAELKMPMLDYLQKYHRISIATIYNDRHGFIRRSAYGEFLKAITCHTKSEEAKTLKKKHKHRENAIKHYTEALKLNREFTAVYYNRGLAYAAEGDAKGDLDRAIEDFDKAIDLNPLFVFAYNDRGNAYHAKGDLDRAIEDYNDAIKLNSDFAAPYNNRGNIYAEKGELDRAIEDYTKAITLTPELANPYYNRGRAFLRRREWRKARDDLTTAKKMGFEIVTEFQAVYKRIAVFEEKYGVQVPEDIAALLSGD